MLRRTPLRRVSPKRARENREYAKVRARYMEEHPICEACHDRPSTELHHKRGRIGALLADVRFFMAVDTGCHRFITEHPARAREAGWTSPPGEWNTVPR